MTHCIVVGGGIAGMLSARFLAEAGVRVTLFDKGALGQESSWAGGGIVSPLYPWRYSEAVNQLAVYGQRHYPALIHALIKETHVDAELLHSGLLILDDVEPEIAPWQQKWQIPVERIEGADRLAEIQPGLNPGITAATWMPSVNQLRNPRLVKALVAALQSNEQVTIKAHQAITSLLRSGDTIGGVQTETGVLEADYVLVTAGAWSGDLMAGFHLPKPEIEPVKGQMLLIKALPGLLSRMVMDHGHYLIPRKDGLILAGSTVERCGYDKSVTTAAADSLYHFATEIIPSLESFPVVQQWAGLRPGSIDGLPHIGPLSDAQGLFLNAGHFRNGIVIGLASARLVVDLILERTPVVNPVPYLPSNIMETSA
ncbi:MAG TPA: FAD-dependent oxidoreductase [Gammaproteobacteria bacterium]|nr:FAD-dependent oxidoreductase [Gammaproteobacteria bacterium]